MRLGKLTRLLHLWVKEGLISDDQSVKIAEHMKAQRHLQMLKFIKVLFVLGAFWLVVGLIATIKLIDASILWAIWNLICDLFSPIVKLAKWIAGERYGYLLAGLGCFLVWGL